jgi:hypothetical protein
VLSLAPLLVARPSPLAAVQELHPPTAARHLRLALARELLPLTVAAALLAQAPGKILLRTSHLDMSLTLHAARAPQPLARAPRLRLAQDRAAQLFRVTDRPLAPAPALVPPPLASVSLLPLLALARVLRPPPTVALLPLLGKLHVQYDIHELCG